MAVTVILPSSGSVGSYLDAIVPVYINVATTFTVPQGKQMLYGTPIEVNGVLVLDGLLIEVT